MASQSCRLAGDFREFDPVNELELVGAVDGRQANVETPF